MGRHERDACGTCNGQGRISQNEIEYKNGKATGRMIQKMVTCPQCKGSGRR
jgi:DnaJ-class molecular chaperone